jgi:hypothetical protein
MDAGSCTSTLAQLLAEIMPGFRSGARGEFSVHVTSRHLPLVRLRLGAGCAPTIESLAMLRAAPMNKQTEFKTSFLIRACSLLWRIRTSNVSIWVDLKTSPRSHFPKQGFDRSSAIENCTGVGGPTSQFCTLALAVTQLCPDWCWRPDACITDCKAPGYTGRG